MNENQREVLHADNSPLRHINWRSVWRTTDLDYDGVRLVAEPTHTGHTGLNLKLADFGISANGVRLRFVRRKFHKLQRRSANKYMSSAEQSGLSKGERKNKSLRS